MDEYQDLGTALHEMVLQLCFGAGIRVFAVGDPDQSIYRFNGAKPELLRELSTRDDVKTITPDAIGFGKNQLPFLGITIEPILYLCLSRCFTISFPVFKETSCSDEGPPIKTIIRFLAPVSAMIRRTVQRHFSSQPR